MKRYLIPFLFLALPAYADVDTTKALVDLQGKTLMDPGPTPDDPNCTKCVPLTIGAVAGACLAKEQGKGPGYWYLAQRFVAKEPIKLTAAEVKAVEDCVDKLPPIISGQIDPVIDPNYKPEDIK